MSPKNPEDNMPVDF